MNAGRPGAIFLGGGGYVPYDKFFVAAQKLTGKREGINVLLISQQDKTCDADTEKYAREFIDEAPAAVATMTVLFMYRKEPWDDSSSARPEWLPEDTRAAADAMRATDFVWFEGGDQSIYLDIVKRMSARHGQSLVDEINKVFARGGAVGGTSAGMHIQGGHALDATDAAWRNMRCYAEAKAKDPALAQGVCETDGLHTGNAIGWGPAKVDLTQHWFFGPETAGVDWTPGTKIETLVDRRAAPSIGPRNAPASLQRGLWDVEPMGKVLTETHLDRANTGNGPDRNFGRFGRAAVALEHARRRFGEDSVRGAAACDEHSGVWVQEENGRWIATLMQQAKKQSRRRCFFMAPGAVEQWEPNKPLKMTAIPMHRLDKEGAQFDMTGWEGVSGFVKYELAIDGSQPDDGSPYTPRHPGEP